MENAKRAEAAIRQRKYFERQEGHIQYTGQQVQAARTNKLQIGRSVREGHGSARRVRRVGFKVNIMSIKPIRNEEDYQEAILLLEQLISKDPDPDTDEGDQLSVLSTLIEDYENSVYPETLPTPVQAIKFRMEQANLKPADLVPYIGSPSRVSEVLSGKRSLSLDMIRDLEAGLGIPAKVLIQKEEPKSKFQAWSEPLIREMSKRGYFGGDRFEGDNKEKLLRKFFNDSFIAAPQLAWRKTQSRISARTDTYALESWARMVEIKANNYQVKRDFIEGSIDESFLRKVIQLSAKEKGPLLVQQLLLEHGIRLVILEHLPKTFVDGVAILHNKKRPIVGLSLRYDRVDNFWFTLLHELAHIALHLDDSKGIFIDEQLTEKRVGANFDSKESEADNLAQESIIPSSKWEISPAKVIPSPAAAKSLADELGVNIAVVAGYIQYKNNNYYYLKNIVNDPSVKVRQLFENHIKAVEAE